MNAPDSQADPQNSVKLEGKLEDRARPFEHLLILRLSVTPHLFVQFFFTG